MPDPERKEAMSTYYYSTEWGDVVTLDRVRSEFETFQSEGYYLDESFDCYLEGCMWYNNGDLTPLSDYIDGLKHRLRTAVRFAHTDPKNREDYDDDIAELTARITKLEQYKEV